jgi:hypothetical protein
MKERQTHAIPRGTFHCELTKRKNEREKEERKREKHKIG